MDLMDLKPKSEVVEVMLLHPNTEEPLTNDDGSEMCVCVYAQHSKEYRAAIHDQQDRRIKAMAKKGNTTAYSAADLERDALELLAKVTKEWDITYGGEKPKLTVGKAKEVYSDVFWLRNQIEEALAASMDFTKV
jgi:hypothetical protein